MENQIIKTYFDIQKPFYYPGEQILGSILLEFFDSITCDNITIISKGKQYIKINRKNISREVDSFDDSSSDESNEEKEASSKTNNNPNKILEDIDETKTIFKYKKNLKINNNTISRGKYTFPIEISLPEKIPGSFLYIDNNIYFEIIYTIKIKLEQINYKEVLPLIIRQKEKSFNYQKFNEYNKILGECCWERGKTTIKITPTEKYNLTNNKIKLNVFITNENSGVKGCPLNIDLYQKIIFLPKDKLNKIRLTKLVGNVKGKNEINPWKNFNEDIEIKINEKKMINFYKEQTKAYKYFKNKNILEFLNSSIKNDLVICEYEIYVESQFVGWFKEELGVFNKIILYPPEKGILIPDIENISKDFLNSLVIKKILLNDNIKDDEIILIKNKKSNNNINNDIINDIKHKKGKEKKEIKEIKEIKEKKDKKEKRDKTPKIRRNKKNEYNIDNDNDNFNINNEDINDNFNINEFNKKNIKKKENKKNNYYEDDNDMNKFKKKLGKDFFDDHALDDDFLDKSSES